MKKLTLLCLLSAFLGGWAAVYWRVSPWEARLSGQDASMQQNPGQQGYPQNPGQQGYPQDPGQQAYPPQNAPSGNPVWDALTPDERINVSVYQQNNKSVVNINTKGVPNGRFLVFDLVSEGEGSGMVIDRNGHILTNFHVIEGAQGIHVTLFDGKGYDARLVGSDPNTDVAVLKIDAPAESLFPVVFGSSTNLLVGQRVFAIGNPFGFERTLATGIISSLDRALPGRAGRRSLKSIIQIDAAINPGNSGGPLFDSHGRMIGMNTAIASKTGESAGVAFAIPVNTIARVVSQLIKNGRVRRPESGIARAYQTDRGLLILTMTPKGPAERAGLQGPKIEKREKRQGPFVSTVESVNLSAADMIVAVDGKPIKTADEFLEAVETHQPGDQVVLTVVRAGRAIQVPLQLDVAE